MTTPVELARKCFAVARSTTHAGERDAAISRGMAILERHALNADHFDIPGRAGPSHRAASVELEDAMQAAMQQAMAEMAARLKAEMAARGLAERLMRERARARSPFICNAPG